MAKIYATVPEWIVVDLKVISKKTNKSFSKIVYEIIELGLLSYKNQQSTEPSKSQEKLAKLNSKNTEYLLRILNIESEVLRKLYNEPSRCDGKTADLILSEIKSHVKKHVKNEIK